MASRDILVVIDNPAHVGGLFAPAAALAGASGARFTGLYAGGYPAASAYGDLSGWMQLVEAYLEAQRAEAAAAAAAFRAELAARKLDGDWIYREGEGDPSDSVIALAAVYDLVVLGQPDPAAEPAGAMALRPEAVVLGAGRPVLMVPYAGSFAEIGRRVLVAWNGTREAARALHDAMFALERADVVIVIEVAPPGEPGGSGRLAAADVAAALARRGIAARAEIETAGDIGIDDLLLSRAADLAADLLVMGAYGHSRLREFVLGGVSRGIFRHMTLPVLLAH
ncbi:MAG TPA: universal stress protein [Stellaceae bacterium]|nr:universal stress protein [Stellaceae bacterium]